MTKRAIIADDSMLMRRMIGDSLRACGWEIVGEAANGQQAIDQYRQSRPDVVTMDIVMPGTDGLCALQEILRFDPSAKVVIVSALNQTKLISDAIRKGAHDFLVKPFLPEQIQETVNRCLESASCP
jgi:two-component system, chemotaxis family, chemotaxis protein CheY